MQKGKIIQIIGPVIDVEFSGVFPAIYDALESERVGRRDRLTTEESLAIIEV